MKSETFDLSTRAEPLQTRIYARLLFNYLPILIILVGAMLVAVQIRLEISSIGQELGGDYEALPAPIYPILALSTALALGLTLLTRQESAMEGISKPTKMLTLVFGVVLSSLLTAVLLPDVSQLQIGYFAALGLGIGSFTLLAPPALYAFGQRRSIFYYIQQLWENRLLLLILIYYNVRSRYSQTILGIAWIIIIPLTTSLILAFVFSQIIRAVDTEGVPFIPFFLVGFTVWSMFSQAIVTGSGSLMVSIGLITQVYFPREILVIVKLGEAIVDFAFMFIAMLSINIAFGIMPTPTFIYLPLLVLLQVALMAGFMLFLSYLSIMVRDIPQLVAVLIQLLFYLTPILYPVSMVPEEARFIVVLNPMAPIIDAYREVMLYNSAPTLSNLYYPMVMAGVLLYTGYKFFKANERRIADYV